MVLVEKTTTKPHIKHRERLSLVAPFEGPRKQRTMNRPGVSHEIPRTLQSVPLAGTHELQGKGELDDASRVLALFFILLCVLGP
jgi:hypothetical protein